MIARSLFIAIVVSLLLLGLAGCAGSTPDPGEETAPNTGLEPGSHVFSTTDQIDMPYDVTGDGETTVLMVHCWMCEGSFWDAQIPALESRYRVITLDLPGHGEAGDNRETWSVKGYGDDVAGLIASLDLNDVVLVGHSMGGPVALRTAALAGDRVKGVIAVDTLHDADFDYDQPGFADMIAAFQADFRGVCNNFVGQMIPEEGAEEIRARIARVGCEESNEEAGKSLMIDFGTIDMPALFREAGVPIRAINAAMPQPTRVDNNRKYADFDAKLMENVGHYLHMTRPEEFNGLLLETLEELSPSN